MPHTDLTPDHFLVRHLPETLRPWAMLMRLDRPIGIWLLLLPSWWGIFIGTQGLKDFGVADLYYVALFAFGAVIMRGAGCVINDLWDRKIDAQNVRTSDRPLASGVITPLQAFIFLALLLWIGLIILVQLPFAAIVTGVVAVSLSIFYPLAKRVTWYPQIILGITFNLGILMGCAAAHGSITFTAWCVYIAAIFWTLAYDTIYAHQDVEDDLASGMKSTALKFAQNSLVFIGGFYAILFFILFITGVMNGVAASFYILWACAALYAALRWYLWKSDDPVSCLKTFRANRDVGLLIAGAFLLA